MATQTTIIAQSEQELIQQLAKNLYMPKKSDFSLVGKGTVYDLPMRSKRNVSFNNYDYTRDEGVVRGLNLPQQLLLINQLSERFGTQLSHNTLRTNFDASYSPNGQEYKRNVLVPYWVYTGEMIEKSSTGYKICRVNDVEIVTTSDISSDCLVIDGEKEKALKQIRKYKAGPIWQTEIPTKSGYFNDFKGVIPIDSEIGNGTKGYWNGVYFEGNLSAVGCYWVSVERGLGADAGRPLVGDGCGVLGIGTDATLNK